MVQKRRTFRPKLKSDLVLEVLKGEKVLHPIAVVNETQHIFRGIGNGSSLRMLPASLVNLKRRDTRKHCLTNHCIIRLFLKPLRTFLRLNALMVSMGVSRMTIKVGSVENGR